MSTNFGRIGALDGLRGVAAIIVAIFFHFRHFSLEADNLIHLQWMMQRPIVWLQQYGHLGVDLFFLLSGYIFAAKYLHRIGGGHVSGRDFLVARVARLYPLYLATLLITAAIVWSFYFRFGSWPLLSQNNDAFHFVLNLAFAQSLGLEAGHSFNFPAWSLSVEAVCYLIFFFVALNKRYFWLLAPTLVLVGLFLIRSAAHSGILNSSVGRGIAGFFIGAMIAEALRNGLRRELLTAAVGSLALLVASSLALGIAAFPWREGGIHLTAITIIFPAILIISLTVETVGKVIAARPFVFLGQISYAVYLVHIPIQMVMLLVAGVLGITLSASSPLLFAAYTVSVIAISAAAHFWFELPMQALVKARYARPSIPESQSANAVAPSMARANK